MRTTPSPALADWAPANSRHLFSYLTEVSRPGHNTNIPRRCLLACRSVGRRTSRGSISSRLLIEIMSVYPRRAHKLRFLWGIFHRSITGHWKWHKWDVLIKKNKKNIPCKNPFNQQEFIITTYFIFPSLSLTCFSADSEDSGGTRYKISLSTTLTK